MKVRRCEGAIINVRLCESGNAGNYVIWTDQEYFFHDHDHEHENDNDNGNNKDKDKDNE